MVRFGLNNSKLLVILCVLAVGCTEKPTGNTRLSITFPPAKSTPGSHKSAGKVFFSGGPGSKWAQPSPSSGSEFNCYMIAVGSSDLSSNRCFHADGSTVFYAGIVKGGFAAGTSQEIEVPSGKSRQVYLIGFVSTDPATQCKGLDSLAFGFDADEFSAPYILATQTVDMAPNSTTALTLTVPSSAGSLPYFEECSPTQLSKALPPVTITSVSPEYVEVGGNTLITINGTGFDATTTVDIDGTPCNSPVLLSSNQMRCTTPPGSTGSWDVTVTRGGDSDVLTGGIYYQDATAVVMTTPTDPDSLTTLAISLTGSITHYKYAVRTGSSCTGATYGAYQTVGTNITNDITAMPDGPITVCVKGRVVNSGPPVVNVDQSTVTQYTWTKDTTGPAAFSVTGITGGSDVTVNNVLRNEVMPEVHWSASSGEDGYEITIFENDGTTIACSPETVGTGATSFDFGTVSCSLNYGNTYKAKVEAYDLLNNRTAAAIFSFTVDLVPLVQAAYPSNGLNWLDYVEDDGLDFMSSTGTPCAAGTSTACLHGGEIRLVDIMNEPSCTALSIVDNLGAFDWVCDDVAFGHAVFFSKGLKPNKTLADLLNSGSWKSNYVTITGGMATYTSDPGVWWSNPVTPLSSSGSIQDLNVAGTIYTYASNISVAGLSISQDRIAVIGLGGFVMSWNGTNPNNCNSATGNISAPDKRCIIATPGKDFLWFEGTLDGYHASYPAHFGIFTYGSSFSRFQYLSIGFNADSNIQLSNSGNSLLNTIWSNGSTYGIHLIASPDNRIHNIRASGNSIAAISLDSASDFNQLRYLSLSNNPGDGLVFNGSSDNSVGGLSAFNNGFYGLDMIGFSTNNIVVDVMVSGGTYGAIYMEDADNSKLMNFSVINSAPTNYDAVRIRSGSGYYISNGLMLNNGRNLAIGEASGVVSSTFVNIASGGRIDYDAYIVNSSNVNFEGVFKNGGTCFNDATATGFTNSCVPNVGSSASAAAPTAIKGKVTSDDTANTSDTNGLAAFSPSLDWFNFTNPYRGWGLDGSAFPNANNIGVCTTGSCRIWDLRLSSADTSILKRSGDGTAVNGAFVAAAPCPAEVDGSDSIYFNGVDVLRNANELLDDGLGDDDGLCESGEACQYNPNFGAYQGSGTFAACTFNDGTVSGVTMFGYSTNGE